MSGVETAVGLALGVLPLLISAAEHYDDCLRPFIRYKHFAKEADRFLDSLGIQKVIFRNQCRILLEEIIEHDVVFSMLDGHSGLNHPSWSNIQLEEQLAQLLGESKGACITTIELIQDRLRDINNESQDLATTIAQTSRDTSDPDRRKTWRQCIAKKLRFSFSKPRLDQILCDLRSLNDDFRTLYTQTLKTASLQSQRQALVPKTPCQEVERYQIIGRASRQVYEALGRACSKHTEHQAHFRVEVEQAKITGAHSAQVKFTIAYTHKTLAGSAEQGDLIWFAVDSMSGDAAEPRSSDTTTAHNSSWSQSLKRQIESASDPTHTKTQKRVRFQSASSAAACTSSTLSTVAVLTSDGMRKDFCDIIRKRFREPLQASECVVVLENTDRCRNFVYPSPNKCCRQIRQVVSLRQVISSVSKGQAVGGLALYDRLRLAKILAIAVLQYHSTPWLRISRRSEDIYFFDSNLFSPEATPSIISPHFNVKVRGPCGQLSRASTLPSHNLARNSLLFSLGVVFLEIAYTATMETLQRPIDLENSRENLYTEFFAARRLAKSAKTDMGATYHKIIEKLVECNFCMRNG